MIAVHLFLAELRHHGIQIWLDSGELRYRAPFGAMSTERLQEIKARRDDILQFLKETGSEPPLTSVGPRPEPLPLSFAQQRLWFLSQLEGASAAYHIAGGLRLRGRLDRGALLRALDRIVARHEALRTTFVMQDGEAVQRIAAEAVGFALAEHDLCGIADGSAELGRLAAAEAAAPFDLEHGPLIRGRLVQLAADDHALLVTMHHIVSDGWSRGVLTRELSVLYAAFARGDEDPLAPLPVQYADYAVWQRQWLSGEVLQRQADYWQQQLAGAPALLTLPADHARPAQADYAGASVGVRLDAQLTGALKALSLRQGLTLHMTLLTSFAALLGRLSGQDEVVIGSPVANRARREIEGLIGFFVNTLALRIDVSGTPSFAELLGRAKAVSLSAQEHQDLPFEQVVELVRPPRSLSHAPMFQAMFAWQNAAEGALELPGLTLSALEGGAKAAKFDLTLSLGEAGSEIAGSLTYATALFARATIARWVGYWVRLLEAMVADEGQAADGVALLGDEERHLVVEAWNATAADYPQDTCVHELFEAQAERTPDATAVVFEAIAVSYSELNARANRLAHHLIGLGVKPDDRVAICVERSLEMVVGLLAILKAGGAYVPLDPAYPVERLQYMLEDSAPKAVLADAAARLALGADGLAGHDVIALDAAVPAWADQPAGNPERRALGLSSAILAYVIYTSGSTGRPKGVGLCHGNAVAFLSWAQHVFGGEEVTSIIASTSICFDLSVFELFVPLCFGKQIALATDALHLPANLMSGSVLNTVPSAVAQLVRMRTIPAAVEIINVAGEPLSPDLVRQIYQTTQVRRVYNLYGPSEDTTYSTYTQIPVGAGSAPIGRPIWNTQVYVLDDGLSPVPAGVAGQLYIAGAGLARGYLNRPELTAERFIANPFNEPGSRMYRTGDLARYLPDGNIKFVGRNDDQVKLRGYRIELGEIEARLTEHAGVRETVVVAREDGPGDKRLVAYYTGDAAVGAEALRGHLGSRLPEYMVPAAYVRLDALPLTPNGKLDRRALPAPEDGAYATRGYEPPQGETEEALAAIWSELLGVERVGRHDNFFELGGHSLMAVQLVSRLRQALQVEVALSVLFARPVLMDFASEIPNAMESRSPAIVSVARDGALPLSFAQQRLWFLSQFEGASAAYHMPGGLRLVGRLDRGALLRALDRIVARHEALRTMFVMQDGEVVQRIAAAAVGFALAEHDLCGAADGEAELSRLAAEEAAASFDLEHGPLIRGRLVRLAPDDHALLVTMHHIVSDGWSMGVLTRELSALYAAFARGEADPLAPLAVQYADYAVWQRQWLAGEVLQRQGAYWQQQLSGAPALLTLPADHGRPAQPDYAGASVGVRLDGQLTGALQALSLRHGLTLHMSLLASFAALLARLSGQDEVVIGSPAANRSRSEIEGLIGFFVNTLALRIDVSGSPSFAELLERAKAVSLSAQEHQDLPFEQVVEIVQPPRSLSHAAVFQAMFAWQNAPQGRLALPGLTLSGLELERGQAAAKFDLTLSLGEAEGEITGSLEYATALYEAATIERWLGYWMRLLEAMVADERQAADAVALLDAAERQRVLVDWNATAAAYPAEQCVHELFEAQAERTPQALAVVYEDRALTYGELNAQANRLAHHLRGLGVKPDDRVAICVERSLEMVVGLLGILKAGGAYVPLDPAYPAERLAYMLEDAGAKIVLTHAAARTVLEAAAEELQERPAVVDLLADATQWEHLADIDAKLFGLSSQNCAYVIYTSGSTGSPKGVMVEHRNVVRLFSATAKWFDFNESDVWTLFHSFAFDFSVWEIWGALTHGGRLIVVPALTSRSPAEFYNLVCAEGVTVLNQTPSAFRNLSSAQAESDGEHRLRAVIFGGEALEVSSLKSWFEEPRNQHARLINMYGITETTVHVTYRPLARNDAEIAGPSPVGRRIEDLRVYILDGRLEPASIGVAGEIYIGGAGVARGYLNRPDLTAERFIASPFVVGDRLYKTGDLGRWLPDGNIEYLGRNDFQVKIRGFRIELGEIEARLAEHAAVREAVVVARTDSPGDQRLVAYYVGEADVDAEVLRGHLAARLPEYMVPAAYVRLDALPLTPNGKLDRRALPAPGEGAYATREYEPPQGETEQALAAIWSELLKIERVGRHDNFFELGGHSLIAVTLIERISRRMNVRISISDVFSASQLNSLAEKIIDARLAEFDPDELAALVDSIDSVTQGVG